MSTRHTRSASVGIPPPPITMPGYGPRATIPADGFLNNPEALLSHRRDSESDVSGRDYDTTPHHSQTVDYEGYSTLVLLEEIVMLAVKLAVHDDITPSARELPLPTILDESVPPETQVDSIDLFVRDQAGLPFVSLSRDVHHDRWTDETAPEPGTHMVGANERSPSSGDEDGSTQSLSDSEGTTELDTFFDIADESSTPTIILRSVHSNEECVLAYLSTLHGPLTAFLDENLTEYASTLIMLSVLDHNNEYLQYLDTPTVLVIYDATVEDAPEEADFPLELTRSTDFVILFADGTVEMLGDSSDNIGVLTNRCYQQNPISGCSIAGKEGGTVGLFLKAEDRYWGLSCGHVLGTKSDVGKLVAQPWPHDFKKYLSIADKRVEVLRNDIQNSKNEITKFFRTDELDALQVELKLLEPLRPADDSTDMHKTLRLGHVLQGHLGVVDHSERRRFLDIGIFEVDASRAPKGGSDGATFAQQIVGPDEGILGSVFWQPAKATGLLKWDQFVRKSGRTTGLTFGFVAGVYFDWKYKGEKSEEFFVLQEKSRHHEFANKGDSGSSIITDDGDIVGIVFDRASINNVHIIIDKSNRIPELAVIAERHRSDGSIDTKGLTTAILRGELFVLVQSVEMALQHCAAKGEVIFDA